MEWHWNSEPVQDDWSSNKNKHFSLRYRYSYCILLMGKIKETRFQLGSLYYSLLFLKCFLYIPRGNRRIFIHQWYGPVWISLHLGEVLFSFSRMRSEGFPFIVGVWGWTCVRVVFLVSSSCRRRVVVASSSPTR